MYRRYKLQMNNDLSYSYYGCYEYVYSYWQCKSFDTVKDADDYALKNKNIGGTTIIPIKSYRP